MAVNRIIYRVKSGPAHLLYVILISRWITFMSDHILTFVTIIINCFFLSVMLMSVLVLCIFCLLSVVCCHTLTNKDLYITTCHYFLCYFCHLQ